MTRVLILGEGPAAAAALDVFVRLAAAGTAAPPAPLLLPPTAVVQAEPGLLWVLRDGALAPEAFERLLLLADAPLLALQLGLRMAGLHPAVDARGATSVPGLHAAGPALGLTAPAEATAQARSAARAMAGLPTDGEITAAPWTAPALPTEAGILCHCLGVTMAEARAHAALGPAGIAKLLGLVTGACRMADCRAALAALCPDHPPEAALLPLSFARPIPFAALAAIAPETAPPKPPQADPGTLG